MTEQVTETVQPVVAPTLDQLKVEMRTAMDNGKDADVVRLAKAIQKHSSDILKAEMEKQKVRAESMAGDREALAETVRKAVNQIPGITESLEALVANGFTYHRKGELDGQGVPLAKSSVGLLVPTIRKTGGGGSTGALKDQTGMRRSELVSTYATDEEKVTIQSAQDGAATRKDSARYQAEKPVIKRILADHPELIKR